MDADLTDALAKQVRAAAAGRRALRIIGGDTKSWYGRPVVGEALELAGHRGVVDYEPSELVITARAGTPILDIETQLARHGQMLAFEPPVFSVASTLGGVVATGLSGPRRPFAGAVRDSVLGVTVLDGRGRKLRMGGTVFKNVAGFDAFRLMAGAMGCLGVLLDVSLRVSPRPRAETSLALELDWSEARARAAEVMRQPLPLSGACHDGERLHLRLSGPEAAVADAKARLGGEETSAGFWDSLRLMTHPGLAGEGALWRVSVPQMAELPALEGHWLCDWGGAQRWLRSTAPAGEVRAAAAAAGGHATLFRSESPATDVFARLPPALLALHKRLKAALDPEGVLNPGRMYAEL